MQAVSHYLPSLGLQRGHLPQVEGLVSHQGNDAHRHGVVHGLVQAVDAPLGAACSVSGSLLLQ